MTLFWVRWSLRDLRQRWVQVTALALIIALGVGGWAGLGGTAQWRRESNDRSFAVLNVHDLRLELTDGSYLPDGALADVVGSIPSAARVTAAEERLVVATQVDASSGDNTVLAPGRLVGVPTDAGGPTIDRFDVRAGEAPGGNAVALERAFAHEHDLAPAGRIRLAGGETVSYVGHVLSPEYFIVVNERGGLFASLNYAVVFAPLPMAREISGHRGESNEIVVTIDAPDARAQVADELLAAVDRAHPRIGATVTTIDEERSYRLLYDDIDNDQQFYNIFAGLIFLGAAFGAFNLARRLVDSQRREMGIAMALGVPPRQIAIRPLLVGLELAVLGTALGVGVGLAIGEAMKSLFQELLPLPVWQTSLDVSAYARAAAIGVALPLVGVALPVWRAVRVPPAETLAPPYRSRAHRRLPRIGHRLRLGGSSVARFPVRNLLRSVQRTLLTTLAIAAAVTALLAVTGMLDSFTATIDRAEDVTLSGAPGRLSVDLEEVMPVDAETISAISNDPTVAELSPALRLPGSVALDESTDEDDRIDLLIEVRDLDDPLWHPELDRTPAGDGVVLSVKAADDLGVEVGDRVLLRHPLRTGLTSFQLVDTSVTVVALHSLPLRLQAYVDDSGTDLFALEGLTNLVDVVPTAGTSRNEVKQALFTIPGVASVEGVAEGTEVFRDLLDDFVSFLYIVQGITLILAALISFNATSINVDERRREHATMLAFGLPVRTVLRTMVVENLLIGLLGGIVGVLTGLVVVRWIIEVLLPGTLPDLDIVATVSASSTVIAVAVAVLATVITPLFAIRRLRRMDLSSTLRVVE